jgi:hypothetical protein
MLIPIGHHVKSGKGIVLDTTMAINGHVQIAGITGMGKTHRLRAMISALVKSAGEARKPIRVHVFDPHGDIELPWSSEVKFSEATPYGYNPLEINPDPDFGGPRRAIQKFKMAVNKQKLLGTKQEAVLGYLLEDLYRSRGFKPDDPRSWVPDDSRLVKAKLAGRERRVYLDVAYEHRDRFKALLRSAASTQGQTIGGFDDFDNDPDMRQKKSWWVDQDFYDGEFLMWEPRSLFKTAPTLDDAVRFAERKLKAQYCGTNSAAMALLKDVNRAARTYHNRVAELAKRGASLEAQEREELEAGLSKAKSKLMVGFESYLDAIVTGRELDEIIRYSSVDVLTSVYERLQNLRSVGIYNPVMPPFDIGMPIWRYVIKPLEIPIQRMFVDMVSARIFERAMQRGVQADLIEVLVVDEGARYATDEPGNILNTIANEARKFGLGLWVASQSPAQFSDDFIKATGTVILVGLASADEGVAARKLGIDASLLRQITPHQTALVQIKNKGMLSSEFNLTKI